MALSRVSQLCMLTTTMLPFTSALADDPITDIERIRISGTNNFNDGAFVSSSQGWVSGDTLVERPMLRTGEMLEFIPGMMVTQHSGSGKANQYFLRGFNLDHGTDFAVSVDGMPVNMRSHGHGQGYSDLNYVIPEAVESLSYFKGTYYASIGDFSGAGGARFALKNSLNDNAVHLTLGENNYRRGVLLNQVAIGEGRALSAIEYQSYDGPWTDVSEDIDKKNAMLRYVTPLLDGELSVTGMAYDNSWNGADQIPSRAVQSGRIDRLGSIDPLAGGETSRYSLSANYRSSQVTASVYAIDSDLTLYSNFTYFLDNPDRGDQFEQADDRQIFGGDIATTHTFPDMQDTQLTVGVQWRYDDIDNVGLYNTVARERVSTRREDSIESLSYALYGQTHTHLMDALSLTLGARVDTLDVDVSSLLPDNSGSENDTLLSLKTSLKYAVTEQATAFVNWGQGFHSNDARGAVISVDPVSGEPAQPAPLLVRSNGYETGITVTDEQNYNLSASLWLLELDSELVYVGDAGFTEPSRPSRRYGVEVSAYYWLNQHINADIEAAWTRARFSDEVAGEGDHIPGTVPGVVSAGLSWYASSNRQGLSATLRGRYLSSRTVTGDDSVSAPSTFIVNGQLAYDWESWTVTLEVLNMLDSDDHDIDYYYASRLPGEPDEGIEDLHYHPVEPRTARLTVSFRY